MHDPMHDHARIRADMGGWSPLVGHTLESSRNKRLSGRPISRREFEVVRSSFQTVVFKRDELELRGINAGRQGFSRLGTAAVERNVLCGLSKPLEARENELQVRGEPTLGWRETEVGETPGEVPCCVGLE